MTISQLLRGEYQGFADFIRGNLLSWWQSLLWIALGSGLYGAAMGWWRSPEHAFFVALKFPLIILLTTAGNALINGMLAPLLGLNLSLRQSLQASLLGFVITSVIFGAFSPLLAFLVWNAPAMGSGRVAIGAYNAILLCHVLVIALAGSTGNLRMYQYLAGLGNNPAAARRVLWAWLTVNLLLGSQLSWNLRPFIGSPDLPVQFLRAAAFQGNFFEAVYQALRHLVP